ncbi:UxaA family hydrolase [Acuticoccus sp.]|uniref:UxaA family hydrolase n=1 Tax=Acuticoccus sp. TaxID=1904378 RepID=UPI003B51FA8E
MSGTFEGYARADGRFGTRNHLLVLSVTGLTGPSGRRIAASLAGAVYAGTPYGGGMVGEDRATHRRALAGLAAHPNVGGVVVVGADEGAVDEVAAEATRVGTPVEPLVFDHVGHDALTLIDRGVRAGAVLLKDLSRQRRRSVPLSGLTLGLECGRSDPSSGLAANPLLGAVADAVADASGIAIVGETVEWLGAEDRLAERAASPALAESIRAAVVRRERLAIDAGVDLTGTNPSRTNIEGGLSTIEEKSLGAIAKAGTGPIAGLLAYAERPTAPGRWLMDAPAYAPESVTGFVAAGANLVLFTTGVGNSFGSRLAPTIKLTANAATAERLGTQVDVSAAALAAGREDLPEAARRLLEEVRAVASGTLTFSEIFGDGEETVSRLGEAL